MILVIGVVISIVLILGPNSNSVTPDTKNTSETLGVSSSPNSIEVSLDGSSFLVNFVRVNNISDLTLIENFKLKQTSSQVMQNEGCNTIVNGGFYSKDLKPIGLLINKGEIISQWEENNLFNAVLSINDFDTPRITRTPPMDNLRIAIQTGPILIENADRISIDDASGETARRVVAAVSGENKLMFFMIRQKGLGYSGPKLSQLPILLENIQNQVNEVIADAVNLDGGSASTFISESVSLPEAVMVGNFFCLP